MFREAIAIQFILAVACVSAGVVKEDTLHGSSVAECGIIAPSDGDRANHDRLPWHAVIYKKTTRPYKQLCGGSLVTHKAVISAAHCFWDNVHFKQPAENYAVALGKVYRRFNHKSDEATQSSNVTEIYIPRLYRGMVTDYQNDISVVVLETAVVYNPYIRPVCIDFTPTFDQGQLSAGNRGKVAGWGSTVAERKPSPVLLVADLLYVEFEQCYNESPADFRPYLSADKFCAGHTNGTGLCEGDGGSGLAFLDDASGRYYLRGVASVAPYTDIQCDPHATPTFTRVIAFEQFIKEAIKNWN